MINQIYDPNISEHDNADERACAVECVSSNGGNPFLDNCS
jgi:hypothetical protein